MLMLYHKNVSTYNNHLLTMVFISTYRLKMSKVKNIKPQYFRNMQFII